MMFIFCLLMFLMIQSRSCLSLSEVILYCLPQSLMMLRDSERNGIWVEVGGIFLLGLLQRGRN